METQGVDSRSRRGAAATLTVVVLLVGAFEAFEPADVEACGADASVKKPFDSKELRDSFAQSHKKK